MNIVKKGLSCNNIRIHIPVFMKAIILAGGLGTRLRPLTEKIPKPLLPIKGKSILEHAILNFKRYNVTDIIISAGYLAPKIREYLGDGTTLGVKINYSVEDSPLGTGGALKRAAQGIGETFLAINGDNLADFNWDQIIKVHRHNSAKATLFLYPVEDVTQFGIVRLEGEKILEFIEKPSLEKAPSNLNNAGGYVIEPGVLDILPNGVSSIEKDGFEKLAALGVVFSHIHPAQWFPTDTIEKYKKADEEFKP